MFFVVLKTAGLGFGTYLVIAVRYYTTGENEGNVYQAASTSRADRNLIRACRIYLRTMSLLSKRCDQEKKLTKATPPIERITRDRSIDNVHD